MRNEGLIGALRVFAVILGILGMGAGVMLLAQFNSPGMFGGRGNVSGVELAIAAGVTFYHIVFALLLTGVAQVLEEVSKSAELVASGVGASSENPTSMTTNCPKCGQTYAGDLRGQFCESCGEKL